MSTQSFYKYHYRPCYGSNDMLIEFFHGVENESFLSDVFAVIKDIEPAISDLKDLWQNDEVIFTVSSNIGSFIFSKDIWGLAFIMTKSNQTALVTIDELLEKSSLFIKVSVDDNKYKIELIRTKVYFPFNRTSKHHTNKHR